VIIHRGKANCRINVVTILTSAQLAEVLQVHYRTVLRLRAEGIIRSYRVRTMVRFVLEEVLDDLARAEGELPLRRLDGSLLKSGGPRRRERSLEKGRALLHTLNITKEEDESVDNDSDN
jgi:excisionase family DNA binding protein